MKKENNNASLHMTFDPDPSILEEFFKNSEDIKKMPIAADDIADDIPSSRICDMCDDEFDVPIGSTGYPNAINIYTDAKEAVSTGFTMDLCPKCMRCIFTVIGLGGR